VRHLCVCVCVRARACACAHVYVMYTHSLIQSHSCLCMRFTKSMTVFIARPPRFVLCTADSDWNSGWKSCIERTRVALEQLSRGRHLVPGHCPTRVMSRTMFYCTDNGTS
jgi:hypothetical protein